MNPRRRAALVLATIAALLAPAAHAMGSAQDCQPEDLAPVDAWLATHPWRVGATTPDALVASACKLWPFDKRLLIVVAAYAQDKEQDKNLVVALVDTKTMSVRSAFRGALLEDETWSLAAGGLRIDTSPYDLAPGVRAIGVDVASDALDAPVRGGVTATRSLFVPEGAALRVVLDGLVLATHDKVRVDDIRTTSATIAIDAHRSGGFADLRITRTTNATARGSVATQDRTTLAYDGRRYRGASSDLVHQVAPEGETAPGPARQP